MTTQRGGVPSSSSSAGSVHAGSPSAPVTSVPPATRPGPSTSASIGSPGKPELPWAFIDCPTDTLVVLIAHMLELLCQHNDQVLLTPDALTRFHSRASPGITIVDYLRRIVKYTNLEKIPLLSLLAYIDLTCQNLPTFTLSSLTVHRFLIAGVTAGSKAQCDVFCTNAHYAKVGGIKVGELNSLEREFLRVTGWALCCNADLLQRYYTSLIRSHGGFVQAPEPEVSPFMAFPHAGEVPSDSVPVTPADSSKGGESDTNGSELGSVPEHDEEGEGENGVDEVAEERARGRPRRREEEPMDVDPQEADVDADAASGRSGAKAVRGRSSDAAKHGGGLKSLVGGLFGRRDHSAGHAGQAGQAGQAHDRAAPPAPQAPAPTAATTGNGNGTGPISRTSSATPNASGSKNALTNSGRINATPTAHTANNGHVKPSRPLSSPAHPPTDPPKQLTPRVRTRDERSVESLRGVGMPPAVAVDDCKRRARGD